MKNRSLFLTLIFSLCFFLVTTQKSRSHKECPNKNPFTGKWYDACPHSHDPVRDIQRETNNLLEDLKRETDNLLNAACATGFVAYTRSVLATAGSEYRNKKAEDFLVENGFFARSEFNNVRIYFADLQGQAAGMVPAPNRILFDNSYRNATLNSIILLLAHEMVHIRQLKRMGNERFACQYSKFIMTGQNNTIEKEAYEFEKKVDYVLAGGGREVRNQRSAMCLDVREDKPGGNVVIDLCEGRNKRPYQVWERNGYSFYNKRSRMCLDVREDKPGGNVVIDLCEGRNKRPYQVWERNANEIKNVQSGLCLDVREDKPGGNVVIDLCEGFTKRPYQNWN